MIRNHNYHKNSKNFGTQNNYHNCPNMTGLHTGYICSARSKDNFPLLLVTVDETWVHYCEPENKAQSHLWVAPMAKEVQDSTICWQGDGHVFWDYFG